MKQGREIEGKWDEERVVARVTKKRPEHCLSYQHTSLRSEFGEQISESAESTENQSAEDTACRRHPTASVSKLCPDVSWESELAKGGAENFPCLALYQARALAKEPVNQDRRSPAWMWHQRPDGHQWMMVRKHASDQGQRGPSCVSKRSIDRMLFCWLNWAQSWLNNQDPHSPGHQVLDNKVNLIVITERRWFQLGNSDWLGLS